ncbi:unnamed protein product [Dovyalis caffra]|uniref:Major facilitator superfamily (MFS) profile domain-containing protein n=1 Tax=Dovyalis caffra TaxID=77055 RepID=A0AAV1SB90_9ROSI|nr:unnamed protein product [Dovyalis caffra]
MAIKEEIENDHDGAPEDAREPLMPNNFSDEEGSGSQHSSSTGTAWMVYLSTFFAVFGSLEAGSCAGYSSPTQNALRKDLSLSVAEYSVFGSILTVGAMIGAITSGPIADLIGRKGAMGISSTFCVAGWLAIYFAKDALALYIGRLATGYAMGALSFLVPVYIAEIAPGNLRGILTAATQLMLGIGVSGAFIIGTVLTWRVLALTGLIPCAILLVGLFLIPESPRWLAKRGRVKEFERTLQKLRGKAVDISDEAAEIKDFIKTLERLPKAKLIDLFQRRHLPSVIVNMPLLSRFSPTVGTISYAILQVVVVAFSTTIIDKIGRKPLLLVSASGLVLSCIITGLSFYLKVNELALKSVPILAVTGILLYIASYAAGVGPIPWVLMSESLEDNADSVSHVSLVTSHVPRVYEFLL